MLNKKTLGVKKYEAEAKKLLIKNLFNYLNDIQ